MADLPELNEWAAGIYQLETSDPVLGGPDGIDNLQAKQLANRTKWLKAFIEKIVDGTTAIGKASQLQTARALKFIGAATGSGNFDGSADTEIKLTLADSGVTSGTWSKVTVNSKGLITSGIPLSAGDLPLGSTQPQFDNSKALATTEFVQRALGNFAGQYGAASSQTLTLAQAGLLINASGTVTLTLPAVTAQNIGATYQINNAGNGVVTVQAAPGQGLYGVGNSTPRAFVLGSGDTVTIACVGAGQWYGWGGIQLGSSSAFAASLNTSGYTKLPNGFVEQWVIGTSDNNGTMSLTLPIKFPNEILGGVADEYAPGNWLAGGVSIWGFDFANSTTSVVVARARQIVGTAGPVAKAGISGRIRVWGR